MFANAVCLTVTVICKGTIVLCSNSYMTTMRRNTSVVLMMDLRNCSASDSGRLSTFQINNRLSKTLINHILTYTPSLCILCKHLQTIISPNKCSSVYQMHCEVFHATFQQDRFSALALNGYCIHQSQKKFEVQTGTLPLNYSCLPFADNTALNPSLPTHLFTDIKQNLRPGSLMHMLFLTKRF